jgi:aspartate racemase
MRTIGILGGMSWHSTARYYRVIQEETAARRGGLASAPLLLDSLDFAQVRDLQVAGDWDRAGALLADGAVRLERAGADLLLIATNLMHKVAPDVEAALTIPLLHIADAVAGGLGGATRVGLLGTGWVMAEPFYADRLARHGITTVVPDAAGREAIDAAIFGELTRGVVTPATRALLAAAAAALVADGAQAIVLACTELELAVGPQDVAVPVVDSMRCHALAAVDAALAP